MKMQLLLTVFIWLSSCLTLIADDVILQSAEREGPVHYGSVQLEQALTAHGYRVVTSTTGTPFVIELKTIGEGPAEGYQIRRRQEDGRTHLCVEGNDDRGTLYGALALTEALENGTALTEIQETSAVGPVSFPRHQVQPAMVQLPGR